MTDNVWWRLNKGVSHYLTNLLARSALHMSEELMVLAIHPHW